MPIDPNEEKYAPEWLKRELMSNDTQETRVVPKLAPTENIWFTKLTFAAFLVACLSSWEPISRRRAMTLGLSDKE